MMRGKMEELATQISSAKLYVLHVEYGIGIWRKGIWGLGLGHWLDTGKAHLGSICLS
jgi:hypothetical protein